MFRAFDFLDLPSPIQVMDIGASAILETPIYRPLLDAGLAHLNAFDGDPRQSEGIKKLYGDSATIFGDFLFDGSEQTVYLAVPSTGMTSLLRPNPQVLAFFNGFVEYGRVEATEQVQTRRLDDIEGLPLIDFLKMDIQGAELTVLKNGLQKLRNCLAVQLEVSYVCLYENQPTFGEVDVWMRGQGFLPHKFLEVKRWSITPTLFDGHPNVPGNQLLESDIIYVKSPLRLDKLHNNQLAKFAALAHFSFESLDLCVHLLLELERRGVIPARSHERYLEISRQEFLRRQAS